MSQPAFRKHYGPAAAAILLLVLLTELTLSISHQSLSWDEGDHLFAGYMSWKTADFGINPEHPPLVKAIAALPLLSMDLKVPPTKRTGFFKDEAYFDGRDFIYNNGGEAVADKIIFRARMAAATLSLLLGAFVFLAGREMFGTGAALFGLALIVFEPNMIAHGAYVTTDMGVSCFLFATIYAFYRYAKAPSLRRLVILGVAAGLALASKHSAVLLLPMGLALALTEIIWPRVSMSRAKAAVRVSGTLAAATVIAVLVLWSFYHFRFAMHPGGVPMRPSLAEYVSGLHGVEPRIYLALARWHILPESYLYGLADVRLVSTSFPSYIFGRIYQHGVWFYFPGAFLIKSTIGFMALLVLAAVAVALGKLRTTTFDASSAPLAANRRFTPSREVLYLAIPPVVYLLIATGTGLNIGARHILPMYAFLAVLIGGAVASLARIDRRWAYLAGALLAFHAVSSARSAPVYLAYSNEFWGGPGNTYKYLTDSNTDWGQQLKDVKVYLYHHGFAPVSPLGASTHASETTPGKECWFAYFVDPAIQPSAYGIPCHSLPTADTGWFHYQVDTPTTITGTVLISAGTLTGYEFGSNVLNPYRQFQILKPTAVIDDGVFVYNGTFDMRFAAALGHATRALDLTTKKQLPAALIEAQTAVAIDPDELQAQMVLGDTLTALNRKSEARPAYEKALQIAATMEPSAAAEWLPQIKAKM
ncbi:MAG TPA: glycosyltransferase family 39 protein [Acidisarcina sp.]